MFEGARTSLKYILSFATMSAMSPMTIAIMIEQSHAMIEQRHAMIEQRHSMPVYEVLWGQLPSPHLSLIVVGLLWRLYRLSGAMWSYMATLHFPDVESGAHLVWLITSNSTKIKKMSFHGIEPMHRCMVALHNNVPVWSKSAASPQRVPVGCAYDKCVNVCPLCQ
jgi:hypothetical protein